MSYSIFDYSRMISDRVRMEAYVAALRQAIKPGDVVLDIGTGTGIFSLLACQFGARQVYAIEPSDAIKFAKSIALDNGMADRIEFIQDISTKVSLPERANVIVSDLRGVLPHYELHIPAIVDARERLLAPGGIMIPQRDTLRVAVIEDPELYRRYEARWSNNDYAFDNHSVRHFLVNSWNKEYLKPEQIILPAETWATLDYKNVVDADIEGTAGWTVKREGVAHGLGLWFDTMLVEDVHFSNAPGEPQVIYGNAFFPLEQQVELKPGDAVSVKIQAKLINGEYIWRWDTMVSSPDQTSEVKVRFKQSNFLGAPLLKDRLRKRVKSYMPVLNGDGQLTRFILTQMDGTRTIEAIAGNVLTHFPERFTGLNEALKAVGQLSEQNSL